MVDLERDERAVLAAFGWTPENAPFERLSAAYRALSDEINKNERAGAATGTLDPGSTLEGRAAWALIYGARTRQLARALLEAFPPGPGPIVEVGAGFGPFGLAASQLGLGPVELVELAQPRLADAARIFAAHGQPLPKTTVADGARERFPGAAAIALPFVYGELLRARPEAERSLDEKILGWVEGLAPGGKLFLLEPGTSTSARRLQGLRDRIHGRASILGPCPAIERCPRLAHPDDWCHLTWPSSLGPVARKVAEGAERRWQEVHFSFLVLGAAGLEAPVTPARLLEIRSLGKAKAEARLCTSSGEARWTVLERHDAAWNYLQNQSPGAVLDPQADAFEPKGDGLRFQSPDAFRVLRPL